MYFVLCDNLPLYDLRDEDLVLKSPKVSLKENNAGSFSFTIFPTHPYYNQIQKLKSVIQVFQDEDEIFCGRVIDEKIDFYNRKTVTCEGELGYFNDSIQRPAVYHNYTIASYLQTLINLHNSQIVELNLAITFNAECAGESKTWDYVSLFYVSDNKIYSAFQRLRADDLARQTFVIPSTEFYLYWHTDSSVNNYYGLKVDAVEITDAEAIVGTLSSLPSGITPQEMQDATEIETNHFPYLNNDNQLWHYVHTIPVQKTFGKMFALGQVTVTDNNDSVYKYTNWETTLKVIKSDLLDTYGGHLRIRKQNGIRYLDYLKDYPNTNTQVIEFGNNLLDFTKNLDVSEIATAIIPLGAKLDESSIQGLEERLTIKSVNNNCDFIYSPSAVNTYGYIYKTVIFDDVNVPANLLRKGQQYLQDIQFENISLEVQAVDLNMLDEDFERIKLLDQIRVISAPNGLDRYFPVTQMTITLDKPSSNTIKLGQDVSGGGLSGSASSANAEIMKKINELPTRSSIITEAIQNATALIHNALNGHIVITYNADELLIMDTDDIETATKVWRWNLNGLGYSSDGYEGTYGTAITMDGQIVGDRLVAGSVSAEKISVSYRTQVEEQISGALHDAEEYVDDNLEQYWTRNETETAIQNTKDAVLISARETATAYTDEALSNYSTTAQIKVQTDKITTEVNKKINKNEIISSINQTAETIKIKASKIALEGLVTANDNFKINTDGSMEAKGAKITGGSIENIRNYGDPNYSNYVTVDHGQLSIGSIQSGVKYLDVEVNCGGFGFYRNSKNGGQQKKKVCDVNDYGGYGMEILVKTYFTISQVNFASDSPTRTEKFFICKNYGELKGTWYGSLSGSSDRRLKKNIEDLGDKIISAIGKVDLKQFIFDYPEKSKNNGKIELGAIAQDVISAMISEDVNPDDYGIVSKYQEPSGESYFGLNYTEFLIARNAYLEKRLDELEERIARLEAIILQQ